MSPLVAVVHTGSSSTAVVVVGLKTEIGTRGVCDIPLQLGFSIQQKCISYVHKYNIQLGTEERIPLPQKRRPQLFVCLWVIYMMADNTAIQRISLCSLRTHYTAEYVIAHPTSRQLNTKYCCTLQQYLSGAWGRASTAAQLLYN